MKDKLALTRGWLAKAESDLVSAKKLFDGDGPFDTACFHAQQAIEKLLKAFLAYHGQPIPKTHDLQDLQQACLEIVPIDDLQKIDLTEITDYAVEIRYDLEFWPESELANEAIQIAEKVKKIILTVLPDKCHPTKKMVNK